MFIIIMIHGYLRLRNKVSFWAIAKYFVWYIKQTMVIDVVIFQMKS